MLTKYRLYLGQWIAL